MADIRSLFQLNPEVIYLNHGSFGASPRAVIHELIRLQKLLEWQPIKYLAENLEDALEISRNSLADYIGCKGDDLVYFPNPTTAANAVLRSLDLHPGDEILSTDHEYGAMNRSWKFISQKTGCLFKPVEIPVPVNDREEFIDRIWSRVTKKTKYLFLSHITSQTALVFPIAELCRRARDQQIISIIDGAHAPGQIPLDISSFDPDIYIGACHKWMCSPKGASFLYVRSELQDSIEPLVISWGWESEMPGKSRFLDYHQWQGTRDMSPFLTIPFVIDYMNQIRWDDLVNKSRIVLHEFQGKLCTELGIKPITGFPEIWQRQMCSIFIPGNPDPAVMQSKLYSEYRIEIPVFRWNGKTVLRISFQPYNLSSELELFGSALSDILSEQSIHPV